MLSRDEILEYVGQYNRYQVEKDYLQHIVLSQIYANVSNELVFKGGTALQKVYALNRFSEDLDFTLNAGQIRETGSSVFERIERGLNGINNFYGSEYKKEIKDTAVTYKLKINGPLFIRPQSTQTILVEISTREKIIKKPDILLITPIFKDICPYFSSVMSLDEILAEKTRAILTRQKARDMYDFYFLLHKGATVNVEYINKKLEYYNKKFSKAEFVRNVRSLKGVWNAELSVLMKTVPDFKVIEEYVVGAIKQS